MGNFHYNLDKGFFAIFDEASFDVLTPLSSYTVKEWFNRSASWYIGWTRDTPRAIEGEGQKGKGAWPV